MNIGECFREVRERLGEDAENFWRDSAIYRALNDAVQRFSHEHRWSWLVMQCSIDIAQGATEVQLIDDVDWSRNYNFILVPATGDRDLVKPEKVQPERAAYLRNLYADTSNLPPRYFYLDNRVINAYDPVGPGEISDTARAIGLSVRLIPAADKAYTGELRYYRNVRLLSADDPEGVPDCPIQYHDAIVSLAAGKLWLKELNGGNKAQEMFNVYNSILDQARQDETNNADDEFILWGGEEPRRVRSPFFRDVPSGWPYELNPSGRTNTDPWP